MHEKRCSPFAVFMKKPEIFCGVAFFERVEYNQLVILVFSIKKDVKNE